jgi:hypothetical protein
MLSFLMKNWCAFNFVNSSYDLCSLFTIVFMQLRMLFGVQFWL